MNLSTVMKRSIRSFSSSGSGEIMRGLNKQISSTALEVEGIHRTQAKIGKLVSFNHVKLTTRIDTLNMRLLASEARIKQLEIVTKNKYRYLQLFTGIVVGDLIYNTFLKEHVVKFSESS
jgi:hypothetical protein